ncbi:Fur family transcriptional regulator [Nanoarchaeota archaeon]
MGTRMTNQKLKIFEYLEGVYTHPTAQQVFDAVKKDLPAITLATVYRNLNLLADQGKILRFEAGKEYRYDADTRLHQHAVCKSCGKIFDLHKKGVSTFAMKKLDIAGFEAESVDVIFHGKCKGCN